jgi:anti-sigma factor RsiW
MSDKKCCQVQDDTIERYAMGRLAKTSLARFEEHLLLCEECQDRVFEMDAYLAALRGTLEQPLQAVAHDERRHETRVERDCKATLRLEGEVKGTAARVTDQSASGFGLVLKKKLPAGAKVALALGQSLYNGNVAWCAGSGEEYRLGVRVVMAS